MKYDRNEDDWIRIQDFPWSITWAQAESVNGNLYIFDGEFHERNVVKYNPANESWIVLPLKTPRGFELGCSVVISDCKVLLLHDTKQTLVFDAISETFETNSFPPIGDFGAMSRMKRCAAVMGKINNTVGVMVFQGQDKTHFYQLDPPGSGDWELYSTVNRYHRPVLGRVTADSMVLIMTSVLKTENEIFQNLSTFWKKWGLKISIENHTRSTQVPKSWFK